MSDHDDIESDFLVLLYEILETATDDEFQEILYRVQEEAFLRLDQHDSDDKQYHDLSIQLTETLLMFLAEKDEKFNDCLLLLKAYKN